MSTTEDLAAQLGPTTQSGGIYRPPEPAPTVSREPNRRLGPDHVSCSEQRPNDPTGASSPTHDPRGSTASVKPKALPGSAPGKAMRWISTLITLATLNLVFTFTLPDGTAGRAVSLVFDTVLCSETGQVAVSTSSPSQLKAGSPAPVGAAHAAPRNLKKISSRFDWIRSCFAETPASAVPDSCADGANPNCVAPGSDVPVTLPPEPPDPPLVYPAVAGGQSFATIRTRWCVVVDASYSVVPAQVALFFKALGLYAVRFGSTLVLVSPAYTEHSPPVPA